VLKLKLEALLTQYVEKSGDNFPFFCFCGLGEAEIILMLQKCLDENKPVEVKYIDGVDY